MMNKNNNRLKCLFSALICIFLLLIGSLLSSCSPKREFIKQNHYVKDSISYTVNYKQKDTIIFTKGDTIRTRLPIHYLTENPTVIETEKGSLRLSRKRDTIFAQCEISDLKHEITLLSKEVKELRTNTEIQTKEIPVRYTPKYIKILSGIGASFLAFLLIFILYKTSKFTRL